MRALQAGDPAQVAQAFGHATIIDQVLYAIWRALKCFVWRSPLFYYIVGVIWQSKNIYDTNYDVLIEGFFRTANTFTASAIRSCNEGIRILCHMHCPLYVGVAVKRSKSVVLLVREPIDAIVSYALFSKLPLQSATYAYIDYYKRLIPFRKQVLVVSFEMATQDIDAVIHMLNHRYNLKLDTSGGRPGFIELVRREVERYEWSSDPLKISLPSESRVAYARALRTELQQEKYQRLLDQATAIYRELSTCQS